MINTEPDFILSLLNVYVAYTSFRARVPASNQGVLRVENYVVISISAVLIDLSLTCVYYRKSSTWSADLTRVCEFEAVSCSS